MGLTRIARVKRLDRPLLVTFDAYGTLYRPRAPIHLMYQAVAEEHGLRVKSEQALQEAFRQVFRTIGEQFPNYGKGVLDHPDKWWEMIVRETFEKCKLPGYSVPRILAPDLIGRFSGSAFYQYVSSVPSTIKTLRNIEANSEFPVIIGIVSNSDPRIASILRSLGFSVGDDAPMRSLTAPDNSLGPGPLSESKDLEQQEQQRQPPPIIRTSRPDFDFVLASYDANVEKPQNEIFGLAERYAATMMRQLPAPAAHDSALFPWPHPFHRVHVGDDLHKDVIAAKDAGWKAVYYEPEFLQKLTEEQQEKLGPTTVRCRDLQRGVKQATNEWVELVKVTVEMKEDEKEARDKERKEWKKMEKLDPEKLAETYERRIDEYMRDSTPEKLGHAPTEKATTKGKTKPVPAESMSDHFAKAPVGKKPPSKKEKAPSHIADWHAAGVKKNETNASTSFLRPSSLNNMRKTRGDPDEESIPAPSSSSQKITRSPHVRAQRAKQRQHSKMARDMEAKSQEPVVLKQGVIKEYLNRKREMLGGRHRKDWQHAAGEKREKEKVEREEKTNMKKEEAAKEAKVQETHGGHESPPKEQKSEQREEQPRQHEQEQDANSDSKEGGPL